LWVFSHRIQMCVFRLWVFPHRIQIFQIVSIPSPDSDCEYSLTRFRLWVFPHCGFRFSDCEYYADQIDLDCELSLTRQIQNVTRHN
jgi:hypothetical protein